jgi:sugar/nucleoside kinase (ribokinase family)
MGAAVIAGSLRLDAAAPYRRLVGVGGVGTGLFFALEGNHDLGRNESRAARILDVRDYCKLHIVAHYPAVLLGATAAGEPFHVVPIGKVGGDEAGARLKGEMARAWMDLLLLGSVFDAPTLLSVCFQYPDGSGGNITTSNSAGARLTATDVDLAAPLLDSRTIALAAPEVPLAIRQRLLQVATSRRALRVAALASGEAAECRAMGFFANVDLLALNEDEATALTGVPFEAQDPHVLLDACAALLTKAQPSILILVSVGPHGAFGFEGGRWRRTPTLRVPVMSTAGAGDALLGGVLTGLSLGLPFTTEGRRHDAFAERPLESALELGVLLSTFKVTSPHTIHPGASLPNVVAFAQEHGIAFADVLSRHF